MPYVPRNAIAPSSGAAVHSLNLAPGQQRPSANDVTRPPVAAAAKPRDGRVRIGLTTISPNTYTVSADRIFRQLFGKEYKVDEHSGICTVVPNPAGGLNTAG